MGIPELVQERTTRRLAVTVAVLWVPAIVASVGLIATLVLFFVGIPALVVSLLPVRMAIRALNRRPSNPAPVRVSIALAAVAGPLVAVLGALGSRQWWLRALWAGAGLAWGAATAERTSRLAAVAAGRPALGGGDRTNVRQ